MSSSSCSSVGLSVIAKGSLEEFPLQADGKPHSICRAPIRGRRRAFPLPAILPYEAVSTWHTASPPDDLPSVRRYPRPVEGDAEAGRKGGRGGARARSATDQARGLARPAGGDRRVPRVLAGRQARMSTRRWSPCSPAITASSRRGCRRFRPRSPRRWWPISSSGGAAINQICKTFDISLKVYELALEQPTGDITQEAALDERACAATMAFGMEALASKPDLLVPRRNGHRQHDGRRRRSITRSMAARPRTGSGAAPASTTRA